MKARRLLPYIIGLLVLAFALGSLPRSQLGGSILFHSYWLLYLVYLGPLAILGMIVALILLVGFNWKFLSEGIGYGLAKKKRKTRARSRRSFVVAAAFWALAVAVLLAKGCTPFCSNGTTMALKDAIVGASGASPSLLQGDNAIQVLGQVVQTAWFSYAFLGLLVVSGVVIVQSLRVALREVRDKDQQLFPGNRQERLEAVQEALRLVDDARLDAASRIISCYQHLISAASRMGAPVSSDRTARELESGIRTMFGLEGPAITSLTLLFEETRYSLHVMTDDDAQRAYEYLQSIAEELNIQMTVPA